MILSFDYLCSVTAYFVENDKNDDLIQLGEELSEKVGRVLTQSGSRS